MIATNRNTDDCVGFEISIDEAVYLMRCLGIEGRLPDVLALYTVTAALPKFRARWALLISEQLRRRGILDPENRVRPDVERLFHHIAAAEETLCAMMIPAHTVDTMLRVAVTFRKGRFIVASRSRAAFLVQPVFAANWTGAAMKVIDAFLGPVPPVNQSVPLQLSSDQLEMLANQPPEKVHVYLNHLGIDEKDMEILGAGFETQVTTLLTEQRRNRSLTQKSSDPISISQTDRGRLLTWSFSDLDHQTMTNFAPCSQGHLEAAIESIFEQVN